MNDSPGRPDAASHHPSPGQRAPAPRQRPLVVVIDDFEDAATRLADWSRIRERAEVRVHVRPLAAAALHDALRGADAIVLTRDRTAFGADLLARLPRLSLLVFTGGRNGRLDLASVLARGIPVCNTGWGPSKEATCEAAWGLILAGAKRLDIALELIGDGRWREGWPLPQVLHGSRLGIVGLGEIGRRVARIGRAFGMQVAAWSPHLTTERAAAEQVEAVGFDELLQTSKVLSVHLVLAPTTRNLFSAAQFAQMAPDSLFVNTSRAGLVDDAALIEGLRRGRPGAAVLDVFDEEPLPAAHPLRSAHNLLLSPHIGFVAESVMRRQWCDVVETLEAWLDGRDLPRRIAA